MWAKNDIHHFFFLKCAAIFLSLYLGVYVAEMWQFFKCDQWQQQQHQRRQHVILAVSVWLLDCCLSQPQCAHTCSCSHIRFYTQITFFNAIYIALDRCQSDGMAGIGSGSVSVSGYLNASDQVIIAKYRYNFAFVPLYLNIAGSLLPSVWYANDWPFSLACSLSASHFNDGLKATLFYTTSFSGQKHSNFKKKTPKKLEEQSEQIRCECYNNGNLDHSKHIWNTYNWPKNPIVLLWWLLLFGILVGSRKKCAFIQTHIHIRKQNNKINNENGKQIACI